ncbi:hypothetical protein KSD_89430 [Ktedonobacter sp. SOSP1-85]|uniref:hypothetical protein n=1 Tax=Ktedonobacter sp. SOSP1-85 TaxID=2778367 RepID=UPI001915F91B|nr:hypothetical protein [Ktedonobacter sp. SOSP1-85]GHO81172.1 hypothetical protein KSD_89430 [Ktedonobacter sp. SOSP1-85]
MEWVKNLFSRNYASEETFVQEPQVRELDDVELEGVEGGLGGDLIGSLPIFTLLGSLLSGTLGGGQQQ